MTRHSSLALAAFFAAICACNSDPIDDPNAILDDFPEMIPEKESPRTIQVDFQEQLIHPGRDKQYCQYLDVLDDDMYIRAFHSYQGTHGHHLILFTALVQEDAGTVVDCSTGEDMVRFRPVVSNERFGYEQFPPGFAVHVQKGQQLVLQQHYVNTTEHTLRVRDVVQIDPLPASEVTTLVGFLGLSDITFKFPPSPDEQSMVFDCRIPYDANLLVLGPHMHEWGVRFKTEMGPKTGPMDTLIDVPQWSADQRDLPKISKFPVDSPMPMRGGEVIRTTCVFKNTTKHALEFPEEMCATFGYFWPAHEGNEQFVCGGDDS